MVTATHILSCSCMEAQLEAPCEHDCSPPFMHTITYCIPVPRSLSVCNPYRNIIWGNEPLFSHNHLLINGFKGGQIPCLLFLCHHKNSKPSGAALSVYSNVMIMSQSEQYSKPC